MLGSMDTKVHLRHVLAPIGVHHVIDKIDGGSYVWLAMQCESTIYKDICCIYNVLWIYLGECHLPSGDAKKMLKICFIESLNVQQKRILQIRSDVDIYLAKAILSIHSN